MRFLKALVISVLLFTAIIGVAVGIGTFMYGGHAIPPLSVLYVTAEAQFFLKVRAALMIASAAGFLLFGAQMLATVANKFFKLRTISYGLMGVSLSAASVAQLGALLYGGIWSWGVFVTALLSTLFVIAAAIITATTQEEALKRISE